MTPTTPTAKRVLPDEQNLISVTKDFIASLRIRITDSAIEESLLKHPHFPTLAALTDLLDEYNVEYAAVQTSIEKLDQMVFPAVAHLREAGGKFVLVSGLTDGYVTYRDVARQWRREPLTDFAEKWTGNLLMAEETQQAGDPEFTRKRWQEWIHRAKLPTALAVLALISLVASLLAGRLSVALVSGTLLLGLFITTLLTRQGEEAAGHWLDTFCHVTPKTDCAAVLSSRGGTLFGWLSMTEVGLLYFGGSWFTLLLGVLTGKIQPLLNLLTIITALALPYTFFSVYYQARVVRKWCPLCLLVQGVLWVSFLLLLPSWQTLPRSSFTEPAFLLAVLAGFALPALGLLVYGTGRRNNGRETADLEKELLAWKWDARLFHALLRQQPYVSLPPFSHEVAYGPADATVTLTAVLSPSCGPCARAFGQLKGLVQKYPGDVRLVIRLSPDAETAQTVKNQMIRRLLAVALAGGPEAFAEALERAFAHPVGGSPPAAVPEDPPVAALLREHLQWSRSVGISHTPTVFVGPYELPPRYAISDLKHLLFQ
jgi:uncharacterized membrane protein